VVYVVFSENNHVQATEKPAAEGSVQAFSAAIDIGAPPAEVWAILTDLGSYHEWNPLFVEAAGDVAVGQRIRLRSRHPANGRLMTVKPTITAVEPGTELRWASSLPGVISGEHSFTLSAADGGTRLVQAETFRGLLARFSGRTFANADASFRALNEALKERAEARANRPAGPAS
jgi:hypothetical protein